MKISKLNYTTRKRFVKYLSYVSRGLPGCTQRVIKELCFGVITASSSCISEIGRTLNEQRPLHATIKRITKNIARSPWHSKLEENHLRDIRDAITKRSVIVIDSSDIAKPRARKMEGLNRVHDGSTDETTNGYPYLTAAVVNNHRNEVIPITNRLYSALEPEHKSNNDEFEKLSEFIIKTCGNDGVYVLDRGFCSVNRMNFLDKSGISFVLRSQKRTVVIGDKEVALFEWAGTLSLDYSVDIERIRDSELIRERAWYCVKPVTIGENVFQAVVMQIEGHGIAVMLTNIPVGAMKYASYGAMIIGYYGCRWSIEEMIRFQKDVFDIEDVRVRGLVALKNFMLTITIATAFLSQFLSAQVKMAPVVKRIIAAGNSLRAEVRFLYYQLALGLREIWRKNQGQVFLFRHRHKADPSPLPLFTGMDMD